MLVLNGSEDFTKCKQAEYIDSNVTPQRFSSSFS